MTYTNTICINSTDKTPELINITDEVSKQVKKSKLKNGQILIFSQHTTAAVVIQESEKGLLTDLKELLLLLAPKQKHYRHNSSDDHQKDGAPNGHSHCQHLLLGTSETVPLVNGKMLLGQFQKIFLVELDHKRTRNILVQITGD